ncbi:outer membrane channel protein [Klebsiella pneumoniae]|nr:outer membrane channel protein [Klebsiella pneumoniae]
MTSQVKQAQYNFVGASEQLESAHRSVVQTVRSSFNNVNASISSINAYKQAVVLCAKLPGCHGSWLLGGYAYYR